MPPTPAPAPTGRPTAPHQPAPRDDVAAEELVELLFRRHADDMRRYARTLVSPHDVDDLVAQSFANVLRALRNGHGPNDAGVGYLAATVRNTAFGLSRRRRTRDEIPVGDQLDLTDGLVHHDDDVTTVDDDVLRAFATLSPRHQAVLWGTVVVGASVTDVSSSLGLTPNATAALGYRARSALRRAYCG